MALPKNIREQADAKRLGDLHKKHLAGKITSSEYREYTRLVDEQKEREAAQEAQAEGRAWLIGNRDLSDLIGVSQKTICAWAKLGMPRIARDQYDFKQVFPWWQENINAGPEDRDETITAAKKQYWLEKVENLRIKNEALRGEYVRQDDVLKAAGEVMSQFRNALRSLRTRLPPVLVGKPLEEMIPVIEQEVDRFLADMAEGLSSGKPEPRKKRRSKPARKRTRRNA